MTDIINLNKKRKAKAREAKQVQAAENRLKYGRTKQEKQADSVKAKKLSKHLQAHKRDTKEE